MGGCEARAFAGGGGAEAPADGCDADILTDGGEEETLTGFVAGGVAGWEGVLTRCEAGAPTEYEEGSLTEYGASAIHGCALGTLAEGERGVPTGSEENGHRAGPEEPSAKWERPVHAILTNDATERGEMEQSAKTSLEALTTQLSAMVKLGKMQRSKPGTGQSEAASAIPRDEGGALADGEGGALAMYETQCGARANCEGGTLTAYGRGIPVGSAAEGLTRPGMERQP